MRIESKIIYEIDEHPKKELCFKWIREHWYDLNQLSIDELIDSIEALHKEIGGTYGYSISATPANGEFIEFLDYDIKALDSLKSERLPLTGCMWDAVLIDAMQNNESTQDVLDSLHDDTEYTYSDNGLLELCEVNGYEFYENGAIA